MAKKAKSGGEAEAILPPSPSADARAVERVAQATFGGGVTVIADPLGPLPMLLREAAPVAFCTRDGWVLVSVVDGMLRVQR